MAKFAFTSVPSGAPPSLEVTFLQPSELSLHWREVPCFQQNGPITGYVVRYYATCGPDRDVQQTKSVVTTGSIIGGLTPNTEYAFQVAAVNTNGTGPFSEPIALGGNSAIHWHPNYVGHSVVLPCLVGAMHAGQNSKTISAGNMLFYSTEASNITMVNISLDATYIHMTKI